MNRILLEAAVAGNGQDMQSLIFGLGSLVFFGVIMYFLIIRPQKKKEKDLKEQLSKLRIGDKVITIGGLIGVVANIKDEEVTIMTSAASTLVTFQKAAINTVLGEDNETAIPKKVKKTVKESEEVESDKE